MAAWWLEEASVCRVEWINTVLASAWPHSQHCVTELLASALSSASGIIHYIDIIINIDIPFFIEELAKFGINGILLKKVSVGAIPPRVTGVKVSTSQSGEVSPAILIYFDLKSIMSYNTLRRPKLPHSHALIL